MNRLRPYYERFVPFCGQFMLWSVDIIRYEYRRDTCSRCLYDIGTGWCTLSLALERTWSRCQIDHSRCVLPVEQLDHDLLLRSCEIVVDEDRCSRWFFDSTRERFCWDAELVSDVAHSQYPACRTWTVQFRRHDRLTQCQEPRTDSCIDNRRQSLRNPYLKYYQWGRRRIGLSDPSH